MVVWGVGVVGFTFLIGRWFLFVFVSDCFYDRGWVFVGCWVLDVCGRDGNLRGVWLVALNNVLG